MVPPARELGGHARLLARGGGAAGRRPTVQATTAAVTNSAALATTSAFVAPTSIASEGCDYRDHNLGDRSPVLDGRRPSTGLTASATDGHKLNRRGRPPKPPLAKKSTSAATTLVSGGHGHVSPAAACAGTTSAATTSAFEAVASVDDDRECNRPATSVT